MKGEKEIGPIINIIDNNRILISLIIKECIIADIIIHSRPLNKYVLTCFSFDTVKELPGYRLISYRFI